MRQYEKDGMYWSFAYFYDGSCCLWGGFIEKGDGTALSSTAAVSESADLQAENEALKAENEELKEKLAEYEKAEQEQKENTTVQEGM